MTEARWPVMLDEHEASFDDDSCWSPPDERPGEGVARSIAGWLCAIALALMTVAGATLAWGADDLIKPVSPSWHSVPGKKNVMQIGPCPPENPIAKDGWCTNERWEQATRNGMLATQGDIDRLQKQIDELRDARH